VVKPVAIGGMLMSAAFTLFKMRKSLLSGIKRSVDDVRKAATAEQTTVRTDKDINIKLVFGGLIVAACVTFVTYWWFMGFKSDTVAPALVAALVMLVAGFFFAAVSGYLVGLIGSSNNPISGLTLSTLMVAAILMVVLGARGPDGITATLAVAGVICVSAAVAGEMLQDLKVGHILGGTPWKMQLGDILGVVLAGAVMFFPLYVLHFSDLKLHPGVGGFGGANLPAPQAGLMAALSQGIVGGEMAWPLVLVGIAMGVSLILIKVRSPMLFSVGMDLPLETTFAIFLGGLMRGAVDKLSARRGHNAAQKARVENAGVLAASGFIAGEALMGLVVAAVVFFMEGFPSIEAFVASWKSIAGPLAIPVGLVLAWYLIYVPLRKAGRPDEAAPPTAVM